MMKRHLPSIEALTNHDDDLLIAELKVREVREHVEIARSMLAEVDRLVPSSETEHVPGDEQEHAALLELARLGCKIVELASALSRTRAPTPPRSAISRAS